MTKKVMKEIDEIYLEERECGHTICRFRDEKEDLETIAECIDVDMIYNEEIEEWEFANEKDKVKVEEALDYYYSLHNCWL